MKRLTPLTEQQLQNVSRYLHNQGLEITPSQVDESLRTTLDKVRKEMLDQGFPIPEDDLDLLNFIRACIRKR